MGFPSMAKLPYQVMTTNAIKHHLSKDGSSTLFSERYHQFYHNPNGAVSESKHVFFDTPGLTKKIASSNTTSLSILEVGFGTGLNFLLFLDQYLSNKRSYPATFFSVEGFPISKELASELNFLDFIHSRKLADFLPDVFGKLKPGDNSFSQVLGTNIDLHIYYGLFDEVISVPEKIDFIFHDAFSPEVNPELWTVESFEKLASFGNNETILSTYCAASKARAALAKAGWNIARSPGALGKREMTIASLNEATLSAFDRVNERRLIERYNNCEFGGLG